MDQRRGCGIGLSSQECVVRGPCGVTRWDGENNGNVNEKCGMGSQANGVNCEVVE